MCTLASLAFGRWMERTFKDEDGPIKEKDPSFLDAVLYSFGVKWILFFVEDGMMLFVYFTYDGMYTPDGASNFNLIFTAIMMTVAFMAEVATKGTRFLGTHVSSACA